jgi:hypothetical protein
MKKSGLSLSVAASVAAMALCAGAFAVNENDGDVCGAIQPDPNGGCNVVPAAFQDLGNLSDGTTTITGHIGTYATDAVNFTSRDLDWYSFNLTSGRLVTFTLSTTFSGGGPNNVLFIGPAPACDAPGGQPVFYGFEMANPQVASFWLDAGTYIVIGTSPFEAVATAPVYACGTYSLDIGVKRCLVESGARLQLHSILKRRILDFLVALENDLVDDLMLIDLNDQCSTGLADTHIAEQAGAEQALGCCIDVCI